MLSRARLRFKLKDRDQSPSGLRRSVKQVDPRANSEPRVLWWMRRLRPSPVMICGCPPSRSLTLFLTQRLSGPGLNGASDSGLAIRQRLAKRGCT